LNKIEFYHSPKHGNWLNAAEIEINVMDIECTGRRIGDIETLTREWLLGQIVETNRKRKSTGSLHEIRQTRRRLNAMYND